VSIATVDVPQRDRRSAPRRVGAKALMFVLLGLFVLFFLVPIVWLLLSSTKGADGLSGSPFSFGSFGDIGRNWDALMAFQGGAVKTWMRNSIVYSLIALAITLVVTIPAGYALAKMEFKGRRLLLVTTLIVMMMPTASLVLPTFLEMSFFGLLNTAWSVILPYSFFPFGVFLTYIYFATAVPKDLLAAARVDGCGEIRAFWSIAMPLAAPVIALVGFFSFVQNWNNFFLPYVMLQSNDTLTMPVGLTQMLSSTPTFNPVVSPDAALSLPQLVLATLMSIAPVLIIFLFAQRFLVSGLTAGGTKG
jgi:multiple sugar transport system permease protein